MEKNLPLQKEYFWTTFIFPSWKIDFSSRISATGWVGINVNLARKIEGKFSLDRNVKIKIGPFKSLWITWKKANRKMTIRGQSPPYFLFCVDLWEQMAGVTL